MIKKLKYHRFLFSAIILVFAGVFTFSGCAISYVSNTYYKIVLLEEEKESEEDEKTSNEHHINIFSPHTNNESLKIHLEEFIVEIFLLPKQALCIDVLTPPPEAA